MSLIKTLRRIMPPEILMPMAEAALFTVAAGYPNPYKAANQNEKPI